MCLKFLKIGGGGVEKVTVCVIVAAQLLLVFLMQMTAGVNTDGIFSYTLSNNPYDYLFIDEIYDQFPQNNGWIDAHILKENYVVEKYDRFNYAAVYYHQRHDVHPPLYYFAVHTLSSLFPGEYSNLHTMGVNLLSLLLTDLVMLGLFGLLYGKAGYGIVPVVFLVSMEIMRFLLTWARMYMLLFLFCAWYLYIHAKLFMGEWRKADLVQMAVCIFLGSLTHYYFYLYAGALTIFMLTSLLWRRRKRDLIRYVYSGIVGIAVSWICYPWVLWHVFANSQGKHADLEPWTPEKLGEYLLFLRDRLLHGREWAGVLLLVFWCLGKYALKKEKGGEGEEERRRLAFRRMVLCSGLIYSLVIYTLDGDNPYYSTALYLCFIVWASMVLLDLVTKVAIPWDRGFVRTGMALLGVWMLCPWSVMGQYVDKAEEVVECIGSGTPLTDDFWRVSETHHNYNCIYIEKEKDGLFYGYWFHFGGYRQFKKIPLETFMDHGIREADLAGCDPGGEGTVVYVPEECEPDKTDYRWLGGDRNYQVYEYVGGEG